ncbi:MAG TPA: GerAB/ArcD/ProY family transporter [Firmicutes bacterium]|nr:GerAB/ArcD/ProY family transporter [Candidatus Fermentithermobacillaceae bacterium]
MGQVPGRNLKKAAATGANPRAKAEAGPGTRKKTGDRQRDQRSGGTHEIKEAALLLGHVSTNQIAAMLAFLLGVKSFLITPIFLTAELSTGAWISVIISLVAGVLATIGWLKWSHLTEGLPFLPALQKTLGKPLGTLLCAAITISFLIAISFSMRLFAGGAAIGLLPDVPIEILLITLIAASAYSAWAGLESLARASTFFFAPTVISFVIIVVSSLRDLDLRNLTPLWGPGPAEVALSGLRLIGLWGILPAFAAVKTYVRREEDLAKGVMGGLLGAGVTLTLTVIAVLLFFPYPSGTRLTHPMGILARSIYLGRYVQRVEAIFVFTWFFPSAIQAGFTYFALLVFIAQMAGTNTYRPFLPALSVTTFAIGALPVSLYRAAQLLSTTFFDTAGIVTICLGWVLYVVARLRGIKPPDEGETEPHSVQGSSQGSSQDAALSAPQEEGGGLPALNENRAADNSQTDRGGDSHERSPDSTSTQHRIRNPKRDSPTSPRVLGKERS